MGAIGIKNLGQGGYKFVKNLPEQAKKLLQQNKGLRNELVARCLEWKTLITKIDDLTDAEKQLIAQQEKVWKALGSAEDLGVANEIKNLVKNNDFKAIYDDFINGKVARKFADKLTLEEEAVLRFYTTKEGYLNFNKALRGEIPMTEFYASQEKLMNEALDKLPISNHNKELLYRIENLTENKISELYVEGSTIKKALLLLPALKKLLLTL